jgi:superfamily II DNA/RNA helicase
MEKFRNLGFCEPVLKVISNKRFVEPSQIQEKTIPQILSGLDIIAGSATGTGKTLAFGAGLIKNSERGSGIQALVLVPTRELAEQVAEALKEFSYYKKLDICAIYGGVSINNQVRALGYADIVVATPGRLLDHHRNRTINMSNVKFLVLDEADRMWDMGFKNDVSKIVLALPKDRQTLLFSATVNRELADFSNKFMKSPVEISVESYVDTDKLNQVYYDVGDREKFSLLVHLIKVERPKLAMVFCNTRRMVDFVGKNLVMNGIGAKCIHGGMDQKKRNRILSEFRDFSSDSRVVKSSSGKSDNVRGGRKANVIVCTDVAARGLDISEVTHVYNYDLPKDPRDYVHRIGRTARAGMSGNAINILASRDYDNFYNIQRHNSGLEIPHGETPKFDRARVSMVRDDRRGAGQRRGGGTRRDDRRGSTGQRRNGRTNDDNRRKFGQQRGGRVERGDKTGAGRWKNARSEGDDRKKTWSRRSGHTNEGDRRGAGQQRSGRMTRDRGQRMGQDKRTERGNSRFTKRRRSF